MKFREIFRFEFVYQLNRVTTWICFAVLFVFAFLIPRMGTPAEGIYQNAPSSIIIITVFSSVVWLMLAGAVAGEAAARDVQTGIHPLMYTTPVRKLDYLGGRFLAAFAVNALMQVAVVAGLLLGLYAPGARSELLGPFMPAAYLTSFFFIALPNAFFATAIQFSFAVFSRRGIASYIASILIVVTAPIGGTMVAKFFGNWELVKLFDPVGFIGIVASELETWTPIENNTRLIRLEGMFLWNRLFWFGIAMVMLLIIYLRFRFTHYAVGRGKRRSRESTPVETTPVPHVQRNFNRGTYVRQLLSIAWTSFKSIAKSKGALTIVGVIAFGSVLFAFEVMKLFGIRTFPVTQQVVNYLTAPVDDLQTPWLVIPLLIIFYTGELVWREREAGLSDIADAAPVPDWTLLLGKFMGIVLLVLTWLTMLFVAGILMQVTLGYYNFEIGLYLKTLFGLQLIEYLLFALMVFAVQVIVNQKYLGFIISCFAFGFMAFHEKLGIHHNLLVYGGDPGWYYTDMRGFGASFGPWLWFNLYWMAWALLLAVVARLLWARGREQGFGSRVQLARSRFTLSTGFTAAVAIGLVLTLGGFIFYNTNVLNKYQTPAESVQWRAQYEKFYAQYKNVPQPRIRNNKLKVEIYPKEQSVQIDGTYKLVNETGVAIDTIHLATHAKVKTSNITFDRTATPVLQDETLGHNIYLLQKPLQPGDSLNLSFKVQVQPQGFTNYGADATVVENGTYFTNEEWLPAIGYQMIREFRDAASRKKYGLARRSLLPSVDDANARQISERGDWMNFEAVVGTDDDQVAVAPGALLKTWKQADRRYFHYKTDAPIQNQYSFFSAKYALHETKWRDVAISIFYHPSHAANIQRMERSIHASLDHYTTNFGTYPYKHLTIVERGGTEGQLNGEASIIDYGETFSLFNPNDGPQGLDLPFYVMAHEVAHQFGVRYAPVEGATFLVEGLAVFSGMQVLEKAYGPDQLQNYLNFVRSFYEVPRPRTTPSLLRANNSFLGYRKGPLALYALTTYIGKDSVNKALRRLFDAHRSEGDPFATTLDLYRELKAVTPDSLQYLLRDLFETNTFWKLKTERVTAKQLASGQWEVTLNIDAHKQTVNPAGVETPIQMNDWLEIGVFAVTENEEGHGKEIYLQKHRIRSGKQTITVTVPVKPGHAGIDPNYLMIDLKPEDNIKKVNDHSKMFNM